MGWTGAQYSIFRVLLAAVLAGWFLYYGDWHTGRGIAVALGGAALAVPLALGWRDRLAAGALLLLFIPFHGGAAVLALGWLLVVHAFLPPAPYGSWDARGRPDPGAAWRFPHGLFVRTWIVLVLNYAYVGWYGRYSIAGLAMLHLLVFNPGWIRPRRAPAGEHDEIIFYDGHCGLCHRSVRFVLAEDQWFSFRFSPLGSETFNALVPESERSHLPDSVVIRTPSGELLTRMRAWRYVLARLGGWWRVLSAVFGLLPAAAGNAFYDRVARSRQRIFGRTEDYCPRLSPELRSRFEP